MDKNEKTEEIVSSEENEEKAEKYEDNDIKMFNVDVLFQNIIDWAGVVVVPFACVTLMFAFLFRATEVKGPSMDPTLKNGQTLYLSDFFYTPQYNDIVVVWAPNIINADTKEMGEPIIKRVIGLPGDEIKIDFIGEVVYRNGVALEKSETNGVFYEDGHRVNDYHYGVANENITGNLFSGETEIVPEGKIFIMGDNRGVSKDSRSNDVGYVDKRLIIGKAIWRLNPFGTIK